MANIIPSVISLNVGQEIVVHAWIYGLNDSRHILGPTVPAYGTQLHWGYTGTRRWYTIDGYDHFMVRIKCEAVNVPGGGSNHTLFQVVYADL
ncbi:MAG: hypothetical protein E6I02_03750 [Chloroflexi bacterium]|jgi:hypothetical protein|nr:MAG: hypothetical protein E6I09_07335 [Chloroflexota bacterium]TMG08272.1 MAG: hypothetical protein E6I02_03750 [Chloroflexota bacterium]